MCNQQAVFCLRFFSGFYFLLVADKVDIHYFLLIGLNGVIGLAKPNRPAVY